MWDAAARHGNQISGWLLDREMERTADGVLFTDEQGRLAG